MVKDDLLQQQWFEQLNRSNLNDQQVDKAKVSLSQLQGIMSEFRDMRQHILKDDALSDSGRRTRAATLGADVLERLDQVVGAEIKLLDVRIGELSDLIRPQRPDTDPTIELLKQQEIRALLMAKSEIEIITTYQELAVTGRDDLTMRAIEEAPVIFPLIQDRAILEAGKRSRGERHNADSAKTLSQLKQWRATLSGALDSAKAELDLPDTFLQKIATGHAA